METNRSSRNSRETDERRERHLDRNLHQITGRDLRRQAVGEALQLKRGASSSNWREKDGDGGAGRGKQIAEVNIAIKWISELNSQTTYCFLLQRFFWASHFKPLIVRSFPICSSPLDRAASDELTRACAVEHAGRKNPDDPLGCRRKKGEGCPCFTRTRHTPPSSPVSSLPPPLLVWSLYTADHGSQWKGGV